MHSYHMVSLRIVLSDRFYFQGIFGDCFFCVLGQGDRPATDLRRLHFVSISECCRIQYQNCRQQDGQNIRTETDVFLSPALFSGTDRCLAVTLSIHGCSFPCETVRVEIDSHKDNMSARQDVKLYLIGRSVRR